MKVVVSLCELPNDLQQKWLEYSCDYRLNSDNNSSSLDEIILPNAETGY
jgi:hypothetical protein